MIEKHGSQRPANIPLLVFVDTDKERKRRENKSVKMNHFISKENQNYRKHNAMTWQKRFVFTWLGSVSQLAYKGVFIFSSTLHTPHLPNIIFNSSKQFILFIILILIYIFWVSDINIVLHYSEKLRLRTFYIFISPPTHGDAF